MSSSRDEPIVPLPSDSTITAEMTAEAVADPCIGITPGVPVGDATPIAADVNGRILTLAAGVTPNDQPDCGNPLSAGGTAAATTAGLPAVSAPLDRTRLATDLNGRLLTVGTTTSLGTAAADPCVGLTPAVAPGAVTPLATDINGRLLALVAGVTPNDTPDCGNPLSMGATAVASADIGLAFVGVGDRTRLAATLAGHLAAQVMGTIANDSVDVDSNPVKVGGVAVAVPATGAAPVSAAGDRVNAAFDLAGRILSLVQGTQAHDAVMLATNNPVNHGGWAGTQAPVLVAALDLVQAYYDTAGRKQVNQEQSIAGEVLSSNVMRGVQGLLSIEQDSAEQSNPALVGTLAATLIVRASAGRFYRVSVSNTTAAGVYVHVINNTTAVAPGAQIIDTFFVPALGTAVIDLSGFNGDYCDTGLCLAGSTVINAITSPGSVLKFYVRFA